MNYLKTIFSKVLTKVSYNEAFRDIIEILINNGIVETEILFGFAWGNEYKNWQPFTIAVKNIPEEIREAENSGAGSFGNDDFLLLLPKNEIEILFCHESDIHLSFNNTNKLVEVLLNNWKAKDILLIDK